MAIFAALIRSDDWYKQWTHLSFTTRLLRKASKHWPWLLSIQSCRCIELPWVSLQLYLFVSLAIMVIALTSRPISGGQNRASIVHIVFNARTLRFPWVKNAELWLWFSNFEHIPWFCKQLLLSYRFSFNEVFTFSLRFENFSPLNLALLLFLVAVESW